MDPTRLPLNAIRLDGGIQPMAFADVARADEYAERIAEGGQFPPAVVFFGGQAYWFADGFHRFEAHARRGLPETICDVRQGTHQDAVLYSVSANATGAVPSALDHRLCCAPLIREGPVRAGAGRVRRRLEAHPLVATQDLHPGTAARGRDRRLMSPGPQYRQVCAVTTLILPLVMTVEWFLDPDGRHLPSR